MPQPASSTNQEPTNAADPAVTEQLETGSIELDGNGLSEQDERELAALGGELLAAAALANVSRVQALVGGNAPAWFQDPTSGWGPLHFAVGGDGGGEYRDEEDVRKCVEILLEAGSPWNAEFMLHALQTKTELTALRVENNTAAGSTSVFLDSKLLYRAGTNGQEIAVVSAGDEEVGVMMGWERPIKGRWQDFVTLDKVGTLLGEEGGFDVVYMDAFSEDYNDLYQFFDHLGDLMANQNSRFSIFNGLGATNATFYDVYTELSALHLEDMGLTTSWQDVDVHTAAEGDGPWGETRKRFSLHLYRMPICVPIQ
ncbi:Arginine N-methyltransferase 2 [Ceratobasidium sp. 395]|nr:Arginine N-methyltransferase 2 [Ceratobasidium sp. 395]